MTKIKSYIWTLLALLLTSCELYMDQLETPDSYEEGSNPKEEVVTEEQDGAEVAYKFTEETVELTDQYYQYIVVNDNDSILYFRDDTPTGFLPKPGDVLFSKMSERFPAGLARKVNEVRNENGMFSVVTEKALYTDVFTDLKLELTDVEYPSYEFTNYADPQQQVVRRSARSRAAGDVIWENGRKFTRTSKFEIHFSNDSKFSFKDVAGLSLSGDIAITIEEYEAKIVDELDVMEGDIYQHTLSMFKVTMDGTGKINGSASIQPFKDIFDAIAAATTKGMIGMVIYPDITFTLSGGLDFKGTYCITKVYEKLIRFDKFSKHKDTTVREIKDKYGAGTKSDFDAKGTFNLDINIQLRFGVSIAGGLLEAGVYFEAPAAFGIVIDSDKNSKKLTAELPNGERTYEPRTNTHIFFEYGLTDAGLYLRLEVPSLLIKTFKALPEKFSVGLEASINVNEFIKVKYDPDEGEGFVFFNLLEVIDMKKIYDKFTWNFYPVFSSKDSYFICSNLSDINREYNQITGQMFFTDTGLSMFQSLELLVFDSEDRYVTHVDCWNHPDGSLASIVNNTKIFYKFQVKAPILWDLVYDDDYYKVYPCYRVKRSSPNPNAAPGDEYWDFYADREFIVKNYRPCANITRYYQNFFGMTLRNEQGNFYFNYSVRLHTQILTSPDIKDWGYTVYYATDNGRPKDITEENMKKCKKLGTHWLLASANGERTYLTSSVTTIVEISLQIKNSTANKHCVYFVPTYKKPSDLTATLLYKDAVCVRLEDDEDLADTYADDELADQWF